MGEGGRGGDSFFFFFFFFGGGGGERESKIACEDKRISMAIGV
jgi:hypothetical protein